MAEEKKCEVCGGDMERKFFMGGFPPIWRCRRCEYAEQIHKEKEADRG